MEKKKKSKRGQLIYTTTSLRNAAIHGENWRNPFHISYKCNRVFVFAKIIARKSG
jgi:hypothetical protein